MYTNVNFVAVLVVTVTKIHTLTSLGQSVTTVVLVLIVYCKYRNSVIYTVKRRRHCLKLLHVT
jgi:hypothetical protein